MRSRCQIFVPFTTVPFVLPASSIHHSPSEKPTTACFADAASSFTTTSLPASRPSEVTARSGSRSPARGPPRCVRCTTRKAMPAGLAATASSVRIARQSPLNARMRKRYSRMRNAMRTAHSRTRKVTSTRPRSLLFLPQHEVVAGDGDAVAIGEDDLGHAPAVHESAVRALQVVQRVPAEPQPDLRILARDRTVVEDDVVLRVASDRARLRAELDAAALFHDLELRFRSARLVVKQRLPVEDHGVAGLDAAQRFGLGVHLLAGRVDEGARDTYVTGRLILVPLELDRRVREEREAAVTSGAEHGLGEVALEAAPVLLELREVDGRQGEDVGVRHEGLRERDGLVRLHRADEPLRELDRLELRPEEAARPAFDDPARQLLEALHHVSVRRRTDRGDSRPGPLRPRSRGAREGAYPQIRDRARGRRRRGPRRCRADEALRDVWRRTLITFRLDELRADEDDRRGHVDPGQQASRERERTVRREGAERAREHGEGELRDLPQHGRYQRSFERDARGQALARHEPEHEEEEGDARNEADQWRREE